MARKIAKLALTKKAYDVVIMNLRTLTSVTDFFVLCSADSDLQVRAIADAVEDGLEKGGMTVWHKEIGSAHWVVLDYVDVVLHVFHRNTRAYYSLERLWGDAEMQHVDDEVRAPGLKNARRSGRAKTTSGRTS